MEEKNTQTTAKYLLGNKNTVMEMQESAVSPQRKQLINPILGQATLKAVKWYLQEK